MSSESLTTPPEPKPSEPWSNAAGVTSCEAEAAFLRALFWDKSEEFGRILEGKSGKLPSGHQISRDDYMIQRVWEDLYRAVRDTDVGLAVVRYMAQQDERIRLLEEENSKLTGAALTRPDGLKTDFRSEQEVAGICVRCREQLKHPERANKP